MNNELNPLFSATRSGDPTLVKSLIEQGADPHQLDEYGYSPILSTIFTDQPSWEVIDYLADLGCNLDQTSRYGESLLSVLIHRGKYDWVQKLIERGADPQLVGFTSLHQAAAQGDLLQIRELASTFQLESKDRWERTPWLTALAADQWKAATELVRLGARTDVKARLGQTPLLLCATTGATTCLGNLLAQSKSPDVLNQQNDFGDSLLHKTVSSGSLAASRLLLEKGASQDIKNSVGEKPINDARSLAMLQLLHEFGADLDHVDGCGEWPLSSAAEDDQLDAVQWLIAQGVKINQTSTGKTALFSAAQHASLSIVQTLIDAGADVNAQDVDGDGIFFYCQSTECADLLLAAGADPKLRNQINETAAQASYLSKEIRNHLKKRS